ncbi:MAG: VWA domain-containing protein, partial [Planctomycetota bacterium]
MVEVLPEIVALAVALIALVAEVFHLRRIRRVSRLAFGPGGRAAIWTWMAPALRVLAIGVAAWGFLSLWLVVEARVHKSGVIDESDYKHLVLVVDVSPSMQVEDAGPDGKRTRRQRSSDILESLFNRIPMRQFKVSLIAVYTDAKPLLEDSKDHEVVRHIMEKMPMWHAFKAGKTDLMSGIRQAVKMAKPWNPRSTHVLVLTDGDTVPATGMPKLPASIDQFLVVGVGNPNSGTFIHDHQSRQDVNTLRQIANRLRGVFHNGNQKHLTSQLVSRFAETRDEDKVKQWTRREWALLACVAGSWVLAILP